jgi:hypothetical protein
VNGILGTAPAVSRPAITAAAVAIAANAAMSTLNRIILFFIAPILWIILTRNFNFFAIAAAPLAEPYFTLDAPDDI